MISPCPPRQTETRPATNLRPPPGVPTAQQVNTSWEEPRLEETQYHPQSDEGLPVFDKRDGESGGSPEDGDGGEEVTSTDFSEEEVGREFKDDVCSKKRGLGKSKVEALSEWVTG
jgi:hypothetical protein